MLLTEKERQALKQARRLKAFMVRNKDNENSFSDIYYHIQHEVTLYDNNEESNQLTKSSADSAKVWLLRYARKDKDEKLFWVSFLIQDTENSQPWLCAMQNSCLSLEKAREVVEKGKSNYRVLSAWIDTYDNNKVKTTVVHECYINALGIIKK